MSLPWTTSDETFLIEQIELGHDLEWIVAMLNRTLIESAVKLVQLYQEGSIMVMAVQTYDAQLRRCGE